MNDKNVSGLIGLNAAAHFGSVHVRQVDIQKYEVRLVRGNSRNSFPPRGGFDDTVSRLLENPGTNVAAYFIIIDIQDRAYIHNDNSFLFF
jgi:hypothetical protein